MFHKPLALNQKDSSASNIQIPNIPQKASIGAEYDSSRQDQEKYTTRLRSLRYKAIADSNTEFYNIKVSPKESVDLSCVMSKEQSFSQNSDFRWVFKWN